MLSKKRIGVALVAAIFGAAMFHGEGVAQETQEFSLLVKVGDKDYTYTTDQLEAMATTTYKSPRGKEVSQFVNHRVDPPFVLPADLDVVIDALVDLFPFTVRSGLGSGEGGKG